MNSSIVPSHRREWLALALLMLGYTILFAVFYPPVAGIEDETGFLNQALVWSRGAVSAERAGFPDGLADFIVVQGRHVPARHPGRSLLALPFLMLGGTRATFLSGLVLHLTTTVIGGLLLARLGRSPLWACLLLFHPTLAIYSRTIMADAAAGASLLLAGLAILAGRPVAAGLAVGLAALMRYHAALALPLVAGSFLIPSRRGHAWRNAGLCALAGSAVAIPIIIHNFFIYGTITEPFTRDRGYFSFAFFVPHSVFYISALLVIWPGMLLAPILDRSPLRWLGRGVVVLFLGPLLFYYFHDTADGWLGTLVVGQRLLQVALPLWVVGYAGVLDDWVAAPLRRSLGDETSRGVAIVLCGGLLAANGLMFARHQAHLLALRQARDAFVERIPAGALIVYQGAVPKLLGTPLDVPVYRLRALEYQGRPAEDPAELARALESERRPWYVAILRRSPSDRPSAFAMSLIEEYELEPVPLVAPLAALYVSRPRP
jgi:hypothetical protein